MRYQPTKAPYTKLSLDTNTTKKGHLFTKFLHVLQYQHESGHVGGHGSYLMIAMSIDDKFVCNLVFSPGSWCLGNF